MRRFYTEHQYDLYEKSKKIASITLSDGHIISLAALSYSHSDNYFVRVSFQWSTIEHLSFTFSHQAFIHHFDIYVYDIAKATSNRVTSDGNRDTVHNGLVEWTYECKKSRV